MSLFEIIVFVILTQEPTLYSIICDSNQLSVNLATQKEICPTSAF